ncbi:adenylyl-sulfate kinase [Candidatus Woesearchaeota archaeon]|nr:adenylyl-sulfate kinase [Candidatus Woesearchaeota archaeon]
MDEETEKAQPKDVVWHDHGLSRDDREKLLGQKGLLLWFTGLSGSGKSTIASAFQKRLFDEKRLVYILDGDNIRHGLNSDLGFTKEERSENIRRIGEVGKLFVDAGVITIAAFISPYRKDRQEVRDKLGERFVEVYVKCSLEECEKRDTKGLYRKARSGKIGDFTGVSAPYEEPENPEIEVDTAKLDVEQSVQLICDWLEKEGLWKDESAIHERTGEEE